MNFPWDFMLFLRMIFGEMKSWDIHGLWDFNGIIGLRLVASGIYITGVQWDSGMGIITMNPSAGILNG